MTVALRSRALRLLARREHTRLELARKLADHGTPEEIDTVLNSLEAERLLSDARFAEVYVSANAARSGPRKLAAMLRAKGVAEDVAESTLGAVAGSEEERARIVLLRKYPDVPADAADAARQSRFLLGRGFGTDTIRRLMRERRT